MFRSNFKLPIAVFNRIVDDVTRHDDYFQQRPNAARVLGATPLQKVAAAIRLLTSGVAANELDDKYRLASSTLLKTLKRFCAAVTDLYAESALRAPDENDLQVLLREGAAAGFPGCIGSIDCMHWAWKNCPSSWKGMFQGREKHATIVLEAISDHRGRFWHFHFGTPGALNDINVLDRSPLFHNAVNGVAPRTVGSRRDDFRH
ncbi:hypothetical protein P43SY_011651 [Pythium insidiosum]|uniref:DDE Tnp4 domain-containing protein n=1 Tax=Pythium insidiosum TaxID=114742 RepID=A0AAD5Q139_PYTIN|nr:hypothetical protein P43SY_011651 [Pythium insidiosum]